jgi:hypothetical protein
MDAIQSSPYKDYYLNYKTYQDKSTELENNIRKELVKYKKKSSGNEITVEDEKRIRGLLKEYKDLYNELHKAYAPSIVDNLSIPSAAVLERQNDIQNMNIHYEELEKEFLSLEKNKYKFKNFITEDYREKEEYKNMTNEELMELEKKKMNDQEDKIVEITGNVKQGKNLAKEAKNVIKEQNKQLDQIDEDMERTDAKMNSLTKRFNNYVAHTSVCKMIVILIIELIIGALIYLFLFDVF